MNRYQAVTVVADKDGYVLGRRESAEFVSVPEIGGQVLLWLQEGRTIDDVTFRAGELAGQEVDVEDFLATLENAGVLPAVSDAEEVAGGRPFGQRFGRIVFGPVGMLIQLGIVVAGLVELVRHAELRPTYSDYVPFSAPLPSLLTTMAVSMVLTVIHEMAHKLGAAGLGVYGRISFGRRLFFIVAQTDVTGLWALPRRQRFLPLAAGMLANAVMAALLVVVQVWWGDALGDSATAVARAIVMINVGAIIAQSAVYLRTDFYAILLVISGSRNLWALKGAVARQLIRRPTPDDLTLIESSRRAEIRWARCYLALYLPGIAVATWFYLRFTLRATLKLIRMAWSLITHSGLSLTGVAAALALLLIVVPTSLGLLGAARAAVATLRRTARA
jgi:putative peptide zinc metalloprotease protein